MTRSPDSPQSMAGSPQRQTEQRALRDAAAAVLARGRFAAFPLPRHATSHSVRQADERQQRYVELAHEALGSRLASWMLADLTHIGFHDWR